MNAKDIMTTPVITAPSDGTVDEAVRLMLDNHVSALPVVDADGGLVGLISEGDLMRRVRDGREERRSWWLEVFSAPGDPERDFVSMRSRHVSDVMTRLVQTVEETTPVGEIARLLETKRIKRVPVVRGGKVVGVVSRANLLQALAHADKGALPTPSASDAELRERVSAALSEVPGSRVHLVNFIVENGKVSVWGVSDTDASENAVRVAVENVPGVKEVEVNLGRLPGWGYGI